MYLEILEVVEIVLLCAIVLYITKPRQNDFKEPDKLEAEE